MSSCRLSFDSGTLIVETLSDGETSSPVSAPETPPDCILPFLRHDPRIGKFRAFAWQYSRIVRALYANGIDCVDTARAYTELPDLKFRTPFPPMPHQTAAMKAWCAAKRQGTVVMPTGSGKTYFAMKAMELVKRSCIVLVPTIDLLQQWSSQLERAFQCEIGMLGGGSKEIRDLTVSTYDSAVLQMEFIGNRFGLIVFDECHHLPGAVNRTAAELCLAPYRLGLSATPERNDDGEAVMERLIGKIVYYAHIDELKGDVLAPYLTRRIAVALTPEEEEEYHSSRQKYLSFVRAMRIDFNDRSAWSRFIALCACRPGGREVLNAYLRQRAIARCGSAKLQVLWRIIRENPAARIIIFTADNDTAYQIGEILCLPVLTHKTKAAERKDFLDAFRRGDYPVLVTSKVLNEGVDVPEANIAIVVSGSGSTREHVQRLGRILRKSGSGKQALLYELVSANTSEMSVSERRRMHRAYNGGAGGASTFSSAAHPAGDLANGFAKKTSGETAENGEPSC